MVGDLDDVRDLHTPPGIERNLARLEQCKNGLNVACRDDWSRRSGCSWQRAGVVGGRLPAIVSHFERDEALRVLRKDPQTRVPPFRLFLFLSSYDPSFLLLLPCHAKRMRESSSTNRAPNGMYFVVVLASQLGRTSAFDPSLQRSGSSPLSASASCEISPGVSGGQESSGQRCVNTALYA